MGEDNRRHLYVDGSADISNSRFAVGWVKTDSRDNVIDQQGFRLDISKGCSTVAEVYAAREALESIAESQAVVLHSDSVCVCDAITNNKLYDKIRRSANNRALQAAWETLSETLERHTDVEAIHTQEDENKHMATAHSLANTAARHNEDDMSDNFQKFWDENELIEDYSDSELNF